MGESLRLGVEKNEINKITKYDPWFIEEIDKIIQFEKVIKVSELDKEILLFAKSKGFSDKKIARLKDDKEINIRKNDMN